MKALFGTLLVCILVVLIVMFGQRLRTKHRDVEAAVALALEEDYRDFGSSPPPTTMGQASRFVEMLTHLFDPKSHLAFRSPPLTHRVEAARGLAISNTVAGLEAYSGMSYGTNIQAWQDWLDAQSLKGNGKKMPEGVDKK